MPINAYFKGHGAEVMQAMQRRYGSRKGESVFYATANARGLTAHLNKLKSKGLLKRKTK